MEDEDATRVAFEAIGALDHLIVAAGPAMGTWGALGRPFRTRHARGSHYTNDKFLHAWACARYASDGVAAQGSITFPTAGTVVRSKVG